MFEYENSLFVFKDVVGCMTTMMLSENSSRYACWRVNIQTSLKGDFYFFSRDVGFTIVGQGPFQRRRSLMSKWGTM